MHAVPSRSERQALTRSALVDAAERLFVAQGFHATSLDAVAAEAGYTKGAVYSNFASKEDVFFAVYERRLDTRVAEIHALLEAAPLARDAIEAMARTAPIRSEQDDGWLAVFFEFWAHVLRHEELRERFAALHARVIEPLSVAMVRHAEEAGEVLPEDPRKLATARYAMQLGLQLERLTQPDVVDSDLGARMVSHSIDGGSEDGLPHQEASGLRKRPPRKQGATRA